MTLYIIEPQFDGPADPMGPHKCRQLGSSIVTLAQVSREQIHFHTITEPVGGAPIVLLECSDKFFDQVKNLAGASNPREYDWPFATARSPQIHTYYSQTAGRPNIHPPKP